MSTIQELFQQAQLSEAAYANFIDPQISDVFVDSERIKNALIDSGFSKNANDPTQSAQATAFLQSWRVVSQFSDSGVLNGFSATLFERLDANQQPTGQYTLAFRGSEEFADFAVADLDLAISSVAKLQVVSMLNYVLRLVAGENGLTQQIVFDGAGPSLSSNSITGVGPGIGANPLTVAGHSLGGYLAQVYQRIFGSEGVYTYNALGITDPSAPFFNQVATLLGLPLAAFDSGLGENLVVPGEPAQFIGTVQGDPQIQVFSEKQATNPISAHRIPAVTDALAIYDLLAKIDPALNMTDPAVGVGRITDILKAASNKPAFSLETALDSLRKLFKDPAALNPAPTATDNREQFYQNLLDTGFQARIATYAGQLSISSLTDISVTSLSNLASGSSAFAFRYALKELNPFAVVGNNTLYDRHNQAGELNLYDPAATVRAGMTTQYLADRAQMLVFANIANTNDGNAFGSNQVADQVRYTDLGKVAIGNGGDFVVFLPGGIANFNGPNTRRVTFGGNSTDSLVGRDNTDRLYGGGGTDVLSGNGGNDYLEGGSGMDVYNFGAQKNFVTSNTNDGNDTILDTDGRGVLRYTFRDSGLTSTTVQSTAIAGIALRPAGGSAWQSPDGKFTFTLGPGTLGGNDLQVAFNGGVGGSLILQNFRDGDFGIRLLEALSAPTGEVRTFFGDKQDWDSDPDAEGIQPQGDGFGNSLRADGQGRPDIAEPDRADFFFGAESTEGERFITAGGDDEVNADGISSATSSIGGRDLIETGAGRDVVVAGAGDDELYAEGKVALNFAILAGNTDAPTGIKGDLLCGAAGRDWLVGARANDLLLGGDGEDLIVGGSGDDDIWGDLNLTTYALDWQVTRSETITNGVKAFDETFARIGTSSGAAGGADVIYGGRGRDWIFGGIGDDFLDAGADDDVAMGEAPLLPDLIAPKSHHIEQGS